MPSDNFTHANYKTRSHSSTAHKPKRLKTDKLNDNFNLRTYRFKELKGMMANNDGDFLPKHVDIPSRSSRFQRMAVTE